MTAHPGMTLRQDMHRCPDDQSRRDVPPMPGHQVKAGRRTVAHDRDWHPPDDETWVPETDAPTSVGDVRTTDLPDTRFGCDCETSLDDHLVVIAGQPPDHGAHKWMVRVDSPVVGSPMLVGHPVFAGHLLGRCRHLVDAIN